MNFGLEPVISSVLPPVQHSNYSHMVFEKDLVDSNLEEEQADSQVDGLVLEKANLVDTTGLAISWPKTTWTRINRMDFGLGGLTKALTLPSLGKRDTRTNSNDQDEDIQTKKGRVELRGSVEGSDVKISTGVGQPPLPEAMRFC